MDVKIIDTTLRDGEQAPGVSFTNREKFDICDKLIEAGIDEIEAGIPVVDSNTFNFIKDLVSCNLPCSISAWSRLHKGDIEKTILTGVEHIHISVPTSKYHLKSQMGSLTKVVGFFENNMSMLNDHFKSISIGLQDTFRTDKKDLITMLSYLNSLNIHRVRVSDTVGSAIPSEVNRLINTVKTHFNGSIDFHGHNDLGLATANSLTALEAGANSVNVTVNGIGERAGNASIEEIAVILHRHSFLNTNIRLMDLLPLCETVANYSHRTIPVDKPIIGDLVFTHESGIHCRELINNPASYQPFSPELLGDKHTEIVIGSHSGRASVKEVLKQAGYTLSEELLPHLTNKLKEISRMKKGFLTKKEIENIYFEEMNQYGNIM